MEQYEYSVVRVELGIVYSHDKESAERKCSMGGMKWGNSSGLVTLDEPNFWGNLTIDKIIEMKNRLEELEDHLKNSIHWGINDFESRANHLEELHECIIYDRTKFKKALKSMINKHNQNVGISISTIDFWLNSFCYTDFTKKHGRIWKEVTMEKALKYWQEQPVFLYRFEDNSESQLNTGDKDPKDFIESVFSEISENDNFTFFIEKEK